jgi:uroporphyrinogen-III synthase
VVSRPELLAALPGAEDAHTVEVTVNRLRRALGRPELVRTVVRRGYRLALGEEADPPSTRLPTVSLQTSTE